MPYRNTDAPGRIECTIPHDGETPALHLAAVAASRFFDDHAPKDEYGRVNGPPSMTQIVVAYGSRAWRFVKEIRNEFGDGHMVSTPEVS